MAGKRGGKRVGMQHEHGDETEKLMHARCDMTWQGTVYFASALHCLILPEMRSLQKWVLQYVCLVVHILMQCDLRCLMAWPHGWNRRVRSLFTLKTCMDVVLLE